MDSVNVLVQQLKACLPAILAARPVALAYLYGSAAQGIATPLSDVDIALVADDRALVSLERWDVELGIEVAVEGACGIDNTDVRIINDAPLAIRGAVAMQGVLLYSRDEQARVEFETKTRDEYFDYQPIARQLREAFFADLREHGLYGQR